MRNTQAEAHNLKRSCWLCLLAGLLVVAGLFLGAVAAAQKPPILEIHGLALEQQIDTGALFYTDLEESALAEQWMWTQLGDSD